MQLREVFERIHATTRYARLAKADAVLICVPTPLTLQPRAGSGALDRLLRARWPRSCRRGQLVVLELTTYPGTTRERVAPLLEASGLTGGRDFQLAFSPERVDPGRTELHAAQYAEGRRGAETQACALVRGGDYGAVCDQW